MQLLPLGAITQGLKGEQLAELHDQQQAGAVGFSDDQHTIRNARLMLLALGDWGETMAETISGGYYIGEDGLPHDAFGRLLSVSQETAVDVMDGLDGVDGLQQDRAPDARSCRRGVA